MADITKEIKYGKIYRVRRREPEGKPYFGERYIVFTKVEDKDITENKYTRWVDYLFLEDPDRIMHGDVYSINERYEIEEVSRWVDIISR